MLSGGEDSATVVSTGWPRYRRLVDGRNYYRILSPSTFQELQKIGSRWILHHVEARVYPELQRIADMLDPDNGSYEDCTPEEWRERMPEVTG